MDNLRIIVRQFALPSKCTKLMYLPLMFNCNLSRLNPALVAATEKDEAYSFSPRFYCNEPAILGKNRTW